ncbi:MAG: hypothetical protein HKN35_07610 [Woeseia sp.]|nr:hypothetical protein [Woeseia sp.]
MAMPAASLRGFTFREADDNDFPQIERLYASRGIRMGWSGWKYRGSPDGNARVMVAVDACNAIVGTMAYLPRRFSVPGGQLLTVWQVVDIFSSPKLREQRVFLGLLKYASELVVGPQFGLPNRNSRIYSRSPGWRVIGRYDVWLFPVKIGLLLANKPLAFFSPLFNAVSRIYAAGWLPGKARNIEMQTVEKFSRDYDLGPKHVYGVRSAAYLNWRYLDNPVSDYLAFEFFDGAEALGYCVFTKVGARGIISDFFATCSRRVCMRLFVAHCRRQGIAYISYSLTGPHLFSLGFVRAGRGGDCVGHSVPDGQWFIDACDTDTEPSGMDSKPC